ncbi:MAG: radical SAM protein [Bacteroidales bacterium]|nr:radical SAM protein [Bacteroidales bacterium]
MSIQFNQIAYGPIKSRRLGNSLGINLMPAHGKFCTFDCIYCEIGWNADGRSDRRIPPLEEVKEAIEAKLRSCAEEGIAIDSITFSGNGEPTLHPDFPAIIDFMTEARSRWCAEAKISVLSNATTIGRPEIVEALKKVDNPILKIDSAVEEIARMIDRPGGNYSVAETETQLRQFEGNFVLQTMFLKGMVDGKNLDCTDPESAAQWQQLVLRLRPREVMMYSLDRTPPLDTIEKVSREEMEKIAAPLVEAGINVMIK